MFIVTDIAICRVICITLVFQTAGLEFKHSKEFCFFKSNLSFLWKRCLKCFYFIAFILRKKRSHKWSLSFKFSIKTEPLSAIFMLYFPTLQHFSALDCLHQCPLVYTQLSKIDRALVYRINKKISIKHFLEILAYWITVAWWVKHKNRNLKKKSSCIQIH